MKGWSVVAGVVLILSILWAVWDWHRYPWIPSPSIDPFAAPAPKSGIESFWLRISHQPRFVDALQLHKAKRLEAKAKREHVKRCWNVLEAFQFEDRYFGCDNFYNGRWYLHFTPEGIIQMATPSDGVRQYMPDSYHGRKEPEPVPLAEVFPSGVRWERLDGRTLLLHSDSGTQTLSIEPDFDATSPKHSGTNLTFTDSEDRSIRFKLSLSDHWEGDYNAWREAGVSY